MIRTTTRLGLAALIALAVGCGPHMTPATTRPAIAPTAVELYVKPPANFENHGFVYTPADQGINNFQADVYIDKLKAEAAAMGANGILISPVDEWKESNGRDLRYSYIGGYYQGKFYNFPFTTEKPTRLAARAIYVTGK